MRSARAAALVLFVAACTREHRAPVTVSVPSGTGPLTYELWVLEDDVACPTVEQLVGGGPATTPLAYESFDESGGAALGRVEVGRARFVAIGRDATCAPVLYGCETLAIGEAGVTLTLSAHAWAGESVCGATRSCVEGACVGGARDAGPDAEADAGADAGPDASVDAGADAGTPRCPTPTGGDGGVDGVPFELERIEMGSGLESYPALTPDSDRRAVDVELRDLDGDGDLDVTIVDRHGWWPGGREATRVYRNDLGRRFADVTEDVFTLFVPGTTRETFAASGLWVDLTGDGRLDLFGGSTEDRGVLFVDGAATGLPRVEYALGPPGADAHLPVEAVAAGDVNGDGALDLFATQNGQLAALWQGSASGTLWTDVSGDRLADAGSRFSLDRPVLADFDGDGDLDLLAQPQLPDHPSSSNADWVGVPLHGRYLQNDGGSFVDRSEATGVDALFADGALAIGDFDNDGDLDLVQVGKPAELPGTEGARHVDGAPQELRVLLNDLRGSGRFVDASATAFPSGAPSLYEAYRSGEQAVAADLDHDGWLDVVLVRHSPRVWRNLGAIGGGGVRFQEVRDYDDPRGFMSVAVGDLDGDGDLDFAASHEYRPLGIQLFENPIGGRGALRVELRDEGRPNVFGIGAHVSVYAVTAETRGELVAYRHVIASTDQHADYAQHVALPADGCYEVEVRWPHVEGETDRVEVTRVVREPLPQTLRFPL